MKTKLNRLTLSELEDWVRNYEPIYRAWVYSRLPLRRFVRDNRCELTKVVLAEINRAPKG